MRNIQQGKLFWEGFVDIVVLDVFQRRETYSLQGHILQNSQSNWVCHKNVVLEMKKKVSALSTYFMEVNDLILY